jgi:hypothetical protein
MRLKRGMVITRIIRNVKVSMDKKERKLMALGVLEFVNMLNDASESGYVEKGES